MPHVSVIIPAYNAEAFIADTVRSALDQTYRDLEVIVVDDGSADGTLKALEQFQGRVRVHAQANGGVARARNAGVRLAAGSWIAFLDADDLWLPGKLERQEARLRDRPGFCLWFSQFQNFWMPELAGEAQQHSTGPLAQPLSAWSIGTLLASRDTVERVGPFPEGHRGNENMLWFLRAAEAGAAIDVLPEVLMRRRFHHGNDTRRGTAHELELFLPIVRAWREFRHGRPGE